jgi:quercetin dioxygenase-like cupin family protein
MRTLALIPFLALLASCGCDRAAPAPRAAAPIYTPSGPILEPTWTAEELAKPVAPRRLHGDEHATTFLIHLGTAEKPHTHDQHDITVVLVRGAVRMHLGDRVETMGPGDVVEIPRGVVHWAESMSKDGSVAYAVFSPAYDGSDMHPVAAPATTP